MITSETRREIYSEDVVSFLANVSSISQEELDVEADNVNDIFEINGENNDRLFATLLFFYMCKTKSNLFVVCPFFYWKSNFFCRFCLCVYVL